MSYISLFDIINTVLLLLLLLLLLWEDEGFLDPNIFLCIPASVANAAAVNPKGIKHF